MEYHQKRYNPYEDPSLHYTKADDPIPIDERESFNGVMRHYDIINGHQVPKRMNQIPKKYRGIFRFIVILYVSIFVIFLVYSFINNILIMIRG